MEYYEVGTPAVDGWAVTFGTARMDWAGPQLDQAPPRVNDEGHRHTHHAKRNSQRTNHRIAVGL